MNPTEYFKTSFDQLQSADNGSSLSAFRQNAFNAFNKWGIPTPRHEEWKYTHVSGLFNKNYKLAAETSDALSAGDLSKFRLPGWEEANELFFINGRFSSELSAIRSSDLVVMPLNEAAENEYKDTVAKYLGDSGKYLKDGINALNTAFVHEGVFIYVKKNYVAEHPVYIYNITNARSDNMLSQPRSLVHVDVNAHVEMVEVFITAGSQESLTNQVMEIVVEKDARLGYYKIENDSSHANLVSSTHIRQTGKSHTHTVTISLNGGIIRNNLNMVLDAEYCDGHMYGLYLQNGKTHVDNHTVVDNVKPHCDSNELYKGIMDGNSTAVFNGKIFVQQIAQKTNAYQSNKNILLSDGASVNTKPQLEIFADDVKCSHGCTVGRLDEEGLFYLQSRGISEKTARSLLLHAYAIDILEHIKLPHIRSYVDKLISERLEFDIEYD